MQKNLRLPEVEAVTGLKKPTIYELMAAGRFPKPLKVSVKAVAWLESEIEEWQKQRVAERDGKGTLRRRARAA